MGHDAVVRRGDEGELREPTQVLPAQPGAGEVDRGPGVRVEPRGLELARARRVMVALDDERVPLAEQVDRLGGGRAVTHDIADLEDLVDQLVVQGLEDRLQGGEVGVDVT